MALHELQAPHGAHAEYAIAWAATTTHIPDSLTFEGTGTAPQYFNRT
jgi:NADPH2:quinone reductase